MKFWANFEWKMFGIGVVLFALSFPFLIWAIIAWDNFYYFFRYHQEIDLSVIDRGENWVFLSLNGFMLLTFFGLGLIVASFISYYKIFFSKKRSEQKANFEIVI